MVAVISKEINNLYKHNKETDKNRKECYYYNIIKIYDFKYGSLPYIPYDRFTNIQFIAEGGFSKVYSATWIDKKKRNWSPKIALKVLNNLEDKDFFLNEMDSFNKVSGNMRVIKCFGFANNYALVLQYMKNGDLRSYLKRTVNSLTWEQRLKNIYDICLALNNIHNHKLVHKDLHPGNIFIDSTFAYIGDFGLCGPANGSLPNLAKPNIYGVIPYMAPEILRGKPHTLASDIYSLGVIINEIITLTPPFNHQPHDHFLVLDICRGSRPTIREETPDSLKELIKKCWDANPRNRPTSKEILHIFSNHINVYKNMPLKRLSNFTHPQAIYTSRLLNFSNLPKPINCSNQKEFVSLRNIVQTEKFITECLECAIAD